MTAQPKASRSSVQLIDITILRRLVDAARKIQREMTKGQSFSPRSCSSATMSSIC